MKEPRWREVLCWGAVIAFFVLPSIFFGLQFLAFMLPDWRDLTKEHMEQFRWFGEYLRILAALVFGLAGLNSFDRFRNGRGSPPPSSGEK